MTTIGTEDPFAHLHDEDYANPFEAGMVGAESHVMLGGRDIISLDGDWYMTLDLFDEGLRQRWYAANEDPPSQWAIPRDYEIEAGDIVPVPSCWNVLKPEWFYFEGAAWYTRHITWGKVPEGERVVLNVGAANYRALVFLNGIYVGGHRGGSTPFSLEVTRYLHAGENRLQIMVENRRQPDRVPMHHTDWFNYGGLYREVSLLPLPATFIRDARAALARDGQAIQFTLALSEPVDGMAVVEISELGLTAEVPVAAGRGSLTFPARPERWSPESPRLYDVTFRFGNDTVRERIGFRTIETDGTRILLNGHSVWLKGVCVHEDDRSLGKVSNEADIRRRFRDAKDMGCNFMRLGHYPHHDLAARLADEIGILLWAEVPVYWAIDFANPATFQDAKNQLIELVTRDFNRASIIIWGVGNENADTDVRLAFMSGLAKAARAADPSRLISAACLINRETFTIEDRLADHLDIIGLNEYFGWYEENFTSLDKLLANSSPDKPVLITETGADALAGYRGAGRVLFTEEWQSACLSEQYKRLSACPYIIGMAVWILYDFRTERRKTRFQQGWNRKGLIAEDKTTRKPAFHALQDLYVAHGERGQP